MLMILGWEDQLAGAIVIVGTGPVGGQVLLHHLHPGLGKRPAEILQMLRSWMITPRILPRLLNSQKVMFPRSKILQSHLRQAVLTILV